MSLRNGFWDGKPEAIQVFNRMFSDAKGHLCLEHVKRNIEKKYSKEWRQVGKNKLELLAFSAKFAFHIAADLFIDIMIANEQDTMYFTSAGQGGSLVVQDGLYTAPWNQASKNANPGNQHTFHKWLKLVGQSKIF